jgi:hypothetical protein
MFQNYGNFFLGRKTSIKGQKLVAEVVEQLGVNQGSGGEQSSGGGQGASTDDGTGSSDKQNGLVRVRVRHLHDGWPNEALPIVQMKGGFGSGNNQGTTDATKQIPPVGSKVYVEFENDSQYHGVYYGGSATEDKKIPEFTGDNYGKVYGHADVGGNIHAVGTEQGKEFISRTHVTGTGDMIDKDGNYLLNALKDHIFSGASFKGTFDSGHALDVKGTTEWKFEDLIINAKSIKFQHGGATTNMPIALGGAGPSSPSSRTKPVKRNRPTYNSPGTSI